MSTQPFNESSVPEGEFGNVRLSREEHLKLLTRYGASVTRDYIERLSCWLKNTRKKRPSHYATLLTWIRKDGTLEAYSMPTAPLIEAAELVERAKILMNVRNREGFSSSFEECRAAIMAMDNDRKRKGLIS